MNSPLPSTSREADFLDEMDESKPTPNVIPLGYKPLFSNDNMTYEETNFQEFPFPVSTYEKPKQSLFPGTSNFNSEDNANKATASYNWLNFSSISTDTLLADLKDLESVKKREYVETPAEKIVPLEKEKKHQISSRSHKKKRKRSPSPANLKVKIERELISQNSKKVFIEDVGLASEHAFRVDRKAEQTNLAFNCFNPVQSARYSKESKFRPPIGLTLTAENDWLTGQRGKKKRRERNSHRYCSRQNAADLQNEIGIVDLSKDRIKAVKDKFKQSTATDDFIPTIIPVIKENTKKENLDGNDSEEDLRETTPKFIARKTCEYNQYLRDNPKDEDKWMEFIKFQDSAIEVTFQDEQNRKISERAIFERKISVLDKALEKNSASIKLTIAKMKLCEQYWESAELKKEWQKILFAHPNSIVVWENYLMYLQSHFSSFSFSVVVNGYAKCFAKLNSLLEGTFISHTPPPDLAGSMLRILFRFCKFLHHIGHREKALACFQAMIEFNIFTPPTLTFNMNLNDWIAFFEPFWDSNVPRFGEENASGWAVFMANTTVPEENKEITAVNESEEDKIIQLKLPRHETWCRMEKIREECHWLPWKPNDIHSEEDCEDPDRMVLIDDVSPFLFRLKSVELKFRLIKTYFFYLGMEFQPHFLTACQSEDCHPASVVECPSSWLHFQKSLEYKYEKKYAVPELLNEEIVTATNTSFSTFVDQAVETCICLFDEPYKTEIQIQWLQMKRLQLKRKRNLDLKNYKKILKESRKFFKSLLKEESNRNNLGLWMEYVQLELENGHMDEAKNVIDKIISSQSKNVLESNDALVCKFYKLYSEIELVQNSNNCLKLLISLATGEKISLAQLTSTIVLKVKSLFQRSVDIVFGNYKKELTNCDGEWIDLSQSTRSFLIEWIPCCAAFQYINSGLQAAMLLYEGVIDNLTKLLDNQINVKRSRVKLDLEELYYSYIFLLLHHANTSTVSLTTLRTILDRALDLYPQNIYFLQLLIDIDSRSHISGHLRRHFNKALKLNCHPIVCFYAVLSEMNRLQTLEMNQENCNFGSGILQKIRSYFERSLQFEACQHCPLLWRIYLKFEIENENVKQAKSVFYRALQQCAWNKNIYLDATKIPDFLQEILDIMTEKEIRIRIPIEEVDLLVRAAAQQQESLNDK